MTYGCRFGSHSHLGSHLGFHSSTHPGSHPDPTQIPSRSAKAGETYDGFSGSYHCSDSDGDGAEAVSDIGSEMGSEEGVPLGSEDGDPRDSLSRMEGSVMGDEDFDELENELEAELEAT
jgi:hypothetical protein